MQWLTLRKGAYCALHPRLWPQLADGVAPAIEHTIALQRFAFRTIVDVGANRGQFAMLARALFPEAAIFAFEPLSAPARLFRRHLDGDGRVHLFEAAIGETPGARTIFVASKDDSSSLLRPTGAQTEIFGVEVARTDVIVVKRLADCLSAGQLHGPTLLKIDVQGAELDVLRGSADLLDRFDTIYVECSYLPLYEGQPLVPDVTRWMDRNGFELAGVYNQHVDPARGPVQADFLFVRPAHGRRRGGDA
ncbi:FkbM family methyltransferase [Bradyrhizobium sp. 2TAF24]|uniref:FkbM family methyltransferase n=1 Tax=Bradyrhizobium sp. 2TAF24 TaxID=3233011 RepID=UPI003F8F8CF3